MSKCVCISLLSVPTPPGPISISQRTNSSFHLDWATPADMDDAPQLSYQVTYQPLGGEVMNKTSSINSTDLILLLSGTLYNVNVKAVGPQDLRSTVVSSSAFTCKYNWLERGCRKCFNHCISLYNNFTV